MLSPGLRKQFVFVEILSFIPFSLSHVTFLRSMISECVLFCVVTSRNSGATGSIHAVNHVLGSYTTSFSEVYSLSFFSCSKVHVFPLTVRIDPFY